MANIALDAGKVVLKNGNASCTCCGVVCPPITSEYNVISEAMFNALQAGGNYSATGYGSEYTGCAFSGTENATVPSGNCGASAGVSGGITCNAQGFDYYSFIAINWNISQVGTEYRFTYNGGGSCWSGIFSPTFCYTAGFFINWSYDNSGPPPGSFTNVGTVTLTTSAGSMNFGIWNLDNTATASLNITITPFPAP